MRILINGNTSSLKRYLSQCPAFRNHLGVLHTPRRLMSGFNVFAGADNDAFVRFDREAYLSMLVSLRYSDVRWITCPDVVGNAKETLKLYSIWQPTVSMYKLPCALVAQDGIEDAEIPWQLLQCLFIGGSTAFKYSQTVIDVISEAKKRSKLIHIGRVNTLERIQYFFHMGPDSFDGSGYSRDSEKIIKHLIFLLDLKGVKSGNDSVIGHTPGQPGVSSEEAPPVPPPPAV